MDLFGEDSYITGMHFFISGNWSLKFSLMTLLSELFPRDQTLFTTLISSSSPETGSIKTFLFNPMVSSGSITRTSGSFISAPTLTSCNSARLIFDLRGNRAASDMKAELQKKPPNLER
ncbi:hypothetical protein ACJIZ3_024353 [Penstemon smallii]|uniref:Uncharacterized protein n=1 Tax=Penstemon smallii TaxID=265156 RepID=A0ABD3TRK6_9LAMI